MMAYSYIIDMKQFTERELISIYIWVKSHLQIVRDYDFSVKTFTYVTPFGRTPYPETLFMNDLKDITVLTMSLGLNTIKHATSISN